MALHAIGWAIGSNGLTQAEANLMFASFALSADPAVQQIAVWAYNGLPRWGLAMHAITQTSAFTHDQALTILTTIASGNWDAKWVQSSYAPSSAKSCLEW